MSNGIESYYSKWPDSILSQKKIYYYFYFLLNILFRLSEFFYFNQTDTGANTAIRLPYTHDKT